MSDKDRLAEIKARLRENILDMPFRTWEECDTYYLTHAHADIPWLVQEVERLREREDEMRDALVMVEWIDWLGAPHDDTCPWCENDKREGHAPDCPRQEALELD